MARFREFIRRLKTKRYIKVILIIISAVLGVFILINAYVMLAPQFGKYPDKKRMEKLAKNSIYENGKFLNQRDVPVMLPKSISKLAGMYFKKHENRKPDHPLPSLIPDFKEPLGDSLISVTWLGHSSVYIRMAGLTILTDPVFSKRASPVSFAGPQPFEYTHPLSPEVLPEPDIIMISHDHFDHLDHKAIKYHYQKVKLFVVPLGIRRHLEHWGIPLDHILEFDWWEEKEVFDKINITATPSQHFSGRRKQDNATLWCSWVISNGTQRVFFSGDSGYNGHFKEIGEKFGPFDLALMECGAYGKYWPYIHMLPEETVAASKDLQAKLTLPIHWGKYNLAFHPWTEPIERFLEAALKSNLKYTTPMPGEEVFINEDVPAISWWKN